MQELEELMPDEETFRRVWRRVMPDETASPIAVHPPEPQPPAQPRPPQRPEGQQGDEGTLRRMLEILDEGLAAAGSIVRRRPGARPLWDSLQKSAAQARSAWFLMTGRRWGGRTRSVGGNTPLWTLLREQYVRELELSRLCREGARSRSEALREISPELEEASGRRRGMIRNLLMRI